MKLVMAIAGLLAAGMLSGCVVAGWSSSGGGSIWPGGLGLVVLILVVIFCVAETVGVDQGLRFLRDFTGDK